jgi:hypothetical protein
VSCSCRNIKPNFKRLTAGEIELLDNTVNNLTDLELFKLAHFLALKSHCVANELLRRFNKQEA